MVDLITPVTFNHAFARALIQNENELHTMHLISIKTLYRLMRLEVKMRYAYVLISVSPKISVKTLYVSCVVSNVGIACAGGWWS